MTIDYAEIAIDEIFQDDLLKEIPFVKSVVAFYNVTGSIINRHNTKKLLTFFKEFHSKNIDIEKLMQFKIKFNNDEKYRNEVSEMIVLMNERFLQIEKSKILANLIASHIEEKLTWQELMDVVIVLDNIHPKGFNFLAGMASEQNWANRTRHQEDESLMFACGIGLRFGTGFKINSLGQKLFNFGIKPIMNFD